MTPEAREAWRLHLKDQEVRKKELLTELEKISKTEALVFQDMHSQLLRQVIQWQQTAHIGLVAKLLAFWAKTLQDATDLEQLVGVFEGGEFETVENWTKSVEDEGGTLITH